MLAALAKRVILKMINARGYELHVAQSSFSDHLARAQLACNSGTLIDVGANRGEYTAQAINNGYQGGIVAVEPLPDLCRTLERRFRARRNFSVVNCAVDSHNGTGTLYRASADAASSLLEPTEAFLRNTPNATTVERCSVRLQTLDSITAISPPPFFLKLDLQGAELAALSSGSTTLRKTRFLQIEASLQPVYKSAPDILDLLYLLKNNGIVPVDICRGYWLKHTQALAQVDLLCAPIDQIP